MFVRVRSLILLTLLAGLSLVSAAPFPSNDEAPKNGAAYKSSGTASDTPVEQLEKLKSTDSETSSPEEIPRHGTVHMEMRHVDASVKQNGELISRVTQHGSAESVDGQPPRAHMETEVEIPSEGVHKVIVQDGVRVNVQDQTDAHKEKVFRGAARLVQPSSVAADAPPSPAGAAHTATNNGHRRSFNSDINREISNNMDHYSPYAGVQYSPLDMAEYVFWTGDERGVTAAVEEFLQEGVMSKEEAIVFLQEVKFNMDYLKAHYAQQSRVEDSSQQERLRKLLLEQAAAAAAAKYHQPQYRPRQFPFGSSADIISSLANKNYDLSNSLLPALPALPARTDFRNDFRTEAKRSVNDPMLSTNIINTSDYDREGAAPVSEEEFEEMLDKLRAADELYTQYTLEEVIYQLAKMMFVQTLSREPADSRHAMQRFMSFLEAEGERGQLSRNIEKKVLDVMISALSDTVAEHPELMQPRDAYGTSAVNSFAHPMLDTGVPEPPLSRALLAAYKNELSKGQLMQKLKSIPAN